MFLFPKIKNRNSHLGKVLEVNEGVKRAEREKLLFCCSQSLTLSEGGVARRGLVTPPCALFFQEQKTLNL